MALITSNISPSSNFSDLTTIAPYPFIEIDTDQNATSNQLLSELKYKSAFQFDFSVKIKDNVYPIMRSSVYTQQRISFKSGDNFIHIAYPDYFKTHSFSKSISIDLSGKDDFINDLKNRKFRIPTASNEHVPASFTTVSSYTQSFFDSIKSNLPPNTIFSIKLSNTNYTIIVNEYFFSDFANWNKLPPLGTLSNKDINSLIYPYFTFSEPDSYLLSEMLYIQGRCLNMPRVVSNPGKTFSYFSFSKNDLIFNIYMGVTISWTAAPGGTSSFKLILSNENYDSGQPLNEVFYLNFFSGIIRSRMKGILDMNYSETEKNHTIPSNSLAPNDILHMRLICSKHPTEPRTIFTYEFIVDRSYRATPTYPISFTYTRDALPTFPAAGKWKVELPTDFESIWVSGRGQSDYIPIDFDIKVVPSGVVTITSGLNQDFTSYTELVLSQAYFEATQNGVSQLTAIKAAIAAINKSIYSLIPLPDQLVSSSMLAILSQMPGLLTSSSVISDIINSGRLTKGAIDIQIANYCQFNIIPRIERLEAILNTLTGVIDTQFKRRNKNYDITSIFNYSNSEFPSPYGLYFLPLHLTKDMCLVNNFVFNGITVKTVNSDCLDIKTHTVILAPNQPDLFSTDDPYQDYSENFSQYSTSLFKMFPFSFKDIKFLYLKIGKIPPCYLPYVVYSLDSEVCMV